MADCNKLLRRARRSSTGFRFDELCQLAECFGFEFARQEGSHHVYKRPGTMQTMNFQDNKGKAKPYQVKQLLAFISTLQEGEDDTGVEE
jgi:predicted RNA binding protein YcfA (HicA-like mRNA interferase family)